MKRALAREQAFILVFEKSFNDESVPELIDFAVENCGWETDGFMSELAESTLEHLDAIDEAIAKYCVGWKKNRIPRVSLSIMRVACNEIMFMPDIPVGVSIDEAVELAKKFASEEDAAYINGVLGTVAKNESCEKTK